MFISAYLDYSPFNLFVDVSHCDIATQAINDKLKDVKGKSQSQQLRLVIDVYILEDRLTLTSVP